MSKFIKFLACVALLVLGGTAFAGHLFTQGSANTPTWIQSGQGIAINQYGLESGSGFSVNVERPSVTPSGRDVNDTTWWDWSAGDVMQLTFATTTGNQTFSIAYDAGGSCQASAMSVCGQTDVGYVPDLEAAASALTLSLPADPLSSTNSYTWTITSVGAGSEFSLGGFRIGFANGKVDGNQTGPLDQNSVVSADALPTPGNSLPPIDTATSAYTDTQLNANQVLPKFAGGVLALAAPGNVTAAFTVTSAGGTIDTGASDVTFSGAITDDAGTSGVMKKTGSGVLTLSGVNTFTGGVRVEGGKVAITSDANLGAASSGVDLAGGVLQANETMTIARAITLNNVAGSGVEVVAGKVLTQTGVISGSGDITKSGSGVLALSSGVHTFTGGVNLGEGELRLNATLSNSGVTVSSGALLSGAGVVGGTVALSGTVAPGNSPGTLTVAGDMTMSAGSDFLAEIDGLAYAVSGGAGSYDRIDLTGSAGVFTAAGTLSPILRGISAPANNNFVPVYGDRFRIVSSANATGVTGAFGAVADPVSGMPDNSRFDVIYGANFIDLALTPASLGTFARNYGLQNMVNAAVALDGVRPAQGVYLGNSQGNYFDGLYGLNANELPFALLQSSGQIHAVTLGTNRSGIFAQYGRLANFSQLREPTDDLWLDVSGYSSRIGEDGFATAFKGSGGQIWLGKDLFALPGQAYGVAAGQLRSRIHDVSSSGETTSDMLAFYMLGHHQGFDYDATLGYNYSSSQIDRTVSLSSGSQKNNVRPNWNGVTAQLGLGYAHKLVSDVSGRAYSRLATDHTRAKAFNEAGSSLTALSAGVQTYTSAQLTLGYDFIGRITSPLYKDVNWRVGAGTTILSKGRDGFVDRSLSMHGATWSASEASYTSSLPFVQMSINQRVNADLNFIMSWNHVRAGNMLWRNVGYVGLSYKL